MAADELFEFILVKGVAFGELVDFSLGRHGVSIFD